MSAYDSAASTATVGRSQPARPAGVLTAAAVLAGVAALASLLWGALLLMQGKDLIRQAVQNYVLQNTDDPNAAGGMDDLVDTAYQTFQARAELWLVVGVLAIVCAALLRTARNWVRVVLSVVAVGAAGLAMRDLLDVGPGLLKMLDAIIVLGMVAALVCQWLPASNASVRARKAA